MVTWFFWQTYISNNERIVHLKPRPSTNKSKFADLSPESKSKESNLAARTKAGGTCEECGKHLQDERNRFCSITCKVTSHALIYCLDFVVYLDIICDSNHVQLLGLSASSGAPKPRSKPLFTKEFSRTCRSKWLYFEWQPEFRTGVIYIWSWAIWMGWSRELQKASKENHPSEASFCFHILEVITTLYQFLPFSFDSIFLFPFLENKISWTFDWNSTPLYPILGSKYKLGVWGSVALRKVTSWACTA